MNILSFDIEDSFQYLYADPRGKQAPPTQSVVDSTREILSLLSEYDVTATFFILGIVVEKYPFLVAEIAGRGHEVATHGHSHRFVSTMSPKEFVHELEYSKKLIEDASGTRVSGYRAPAFAFGENHTWVFDAMAETGIEYDSSLVPGRSYDNEVLCNCAEPFFIRRGLVEIPVTTLSFLGRTALIGGTYFRFLPESTIHTTIGDANDYGWPTVLYMHPYEFPSYRFPTPGDGYDYSQVAIRKRLMTTFHRNLRKIYRAKTEVRLRRLLENFEFSTMRSYLAAKGLSTDAG